MANKIGYDVLDFRGGDSADIVASKSKIVQELRKRFRLKKQKGYGSPSARVIKAEDIRKNLKSFKEFLAYINASESEQKKIVASAPPGYLRIPQSLR